MQFNQLSPKEVLNPAFRKLKPYRSDIDRFKNALVKLLEKIDANESEEHAKTLIRDFLLEAHYAGTHEINVHGRKDLVIHTGASSKRDVGVIIEAKRISNKAEFPTPGNLNVKAFHELVLYYLRERLDAGNIHVRHLAITNGYEWYLFDGKTFYDLFYQNSGLRKSYQEWRSGQMDTASTEMFYRDVAKRFIDTSSADIPFTYFNIQTYYKELTNREKSDDLVLIPIFKVLSPQHLLGEPYATDSNTLDKQFYHELLHIIGLEEVKDAGKKIIRRKEKPDTASLLENTISILHSEDILAGIGNLSQYGETHEEQSFQIGLELCLTWLNRILFLKLLEAQLLNYHAGDKQFAFLHKENIKEYDDLNELFFKVLAEKTSDRTLDVARFERVPYLNSSLFEVSALERTTLRISNLKDRNELPFYKKTVFDRSKPEYAKGSLNTLDYLLSFLDSYDFSSEGSEEIQEEQKTLINASVLGLIYEKINGYKDGSFFTPGYITEYMCREAIRAAVVQKFNEHYTWNCEKFEELYNCIENRDEANTIVNSLTICDPAVGSGHFLVSALNEIIAIKSELRILSDTNGQRLKEYSCRVENDELVITDEGQNLFKYTPKHPESQRVQETLFHEKKAIIERCLFGVDINPNSVRICRLRLWIELLKNSFYTKESGYKELETLPNLDINIKQGNSLISRYELDTKLSHVLKKSNWTIESYRLHVQAYRAARDKEIKRHMQTLIDNIKNEIVKHVMTKDITILKKYEQQFYQTYTAPKLVDVKLSKHQLVKEEKQKADLLAKIEKQTQAIEEKKDGQIYEDAFEWRFEFPEVLDNAGNFVGFDVVIGNPPYMRVQEIQKSQPRNKIFYEENFVNAKVSYDLANLFFELAIKISNIGSHNSFIFPHKFFNSESTSVFRDYLYEGKYIDKIAHFGANMIFGDADTYTCVAQFSKYTNDGFLFQRFAFQSDLVNDLWIKEKYQFISYDAIAQASELYGNNQWILFDDHNGLEVFEQIYKNSVRFENIIELFVGLQTSKDDLYIMNLLEEKQGSYILEFNCKHKQTVIERIYEVEKTYFKPILLGKDVHRYEALKTKKFVFFPYAILNGKVIAVKQESLQNSHPLTMKYILENEEIFKSRESGKAKNLNPWYGYIYPKNLHRFEQPKLPSMEICANGMNVTLDLDNLYHSTTVYSWLLSEQCNISKECVLGIANSKLLWWFLKLTGDTLQGDARRVKTNYLNPFPFPAEINRETEQAIAKNVQDILRLKIMGHNTQVLEDEVDQLVFELYGLSEKHVKEINARQ